jgi:hypothetical protein
LFSFPKVPVLHRHHRHKRHKQATPKERHTRKSKKMRQIPKLPTKVTIVTMKGCHLPVALLVTGDKQSRERTIDAKL